MSEIAAPGIHNTQDSNSHASMKSTNSQTDLTDDYVFTTYMSGAYHANWNSWEENGSFTLYFEMFGIRFRLSVSFILQL